MTYLLVHNATGRFISYPKKKPAPEEGYTVVEVTPDMLAVIRGSKKPMKWQAKEGDPAGELVGVENKKNTIPQLVRAWQAKAILGATKHAVTGKTLLVAAESAIKSMPTGSEKIALQAAWDYNADFSRTSSAMLQIADAIGLDDIALNRLFIAADALTLT